MNTTTVKIRVLILDPECEAARIRDTIELGNATIDDIKHTVHVGLEALAVERIMDLANHSTRSLANSGTVDSPAINIVDIKPRLNIEVRYYSSEPVTFVMALDDSVFSEQYLRGRPDSVPIGSCIGKCVPVIQYRRGSVGYRFLLSHFETIWDSAQDITDQILNGAVSRIATLSQRNKSRT